jgi:hypothetical protein
MPRIGWRSFQDWVTCATISPTRRCGVWTVHSFLVVYRPDAQPLQVVRVLSGYRDIAALFE